MAKPICAHLRTKKSYVPALQKKGYLAKQELSAQYFCVKTLHAVGPDDRMVCPNACTAGRQCFQALLRPALA